MVNFEGLEKIRLVVATGSNEWGATKIWPGSWPRGEMVSPAVPLHIHALLSGVLPPFSSFFVAMLSHYQIHALHLDPSSLVLLSAFALLCEAFVGVTPSVALPRHFFSLELVSVEQCSGCVSLKMTNTAVPGALDAELLLKAKGFRRQWVQVETTEDGALLQPPLTPATPNLGWRREDLNDPRLTPILIRIEILKWVGVTMAMVVRGFIRRRIAPLQRHSRPMWAYAGPRDPMRIQVLPLSSDLLHELLCRPTGGDPDELPQDGLPLYNFKSQEALLVGMPLFNEWGFLLGGDARLRGGLDTGGSGPRKLWSCCLFRYRGGSCIAARSLGSCSGTGRGWWRRPVDGGIHRACFQASTEVRRISSPGQPRWSEEEVA
ncbi:hypothetical protein D1007_25841 [Hordeum vulgare]|nr:hypothetical protein D1007_25841 [Hordeum vulgare]